MKIQIVTPFHMQWVDGYNKIFHDFEVVWTLKPEKGDFDLIIFMWMDGDAMTFINGAEKTCPWVVFCRRYEMYSVDPLNFNWAKVDKVIFVNSYLAEWFENVTGIKPEVIHNGINPESWTYKKREHGNKVAWVGFINMKKNLPLALQIMKLVPDNFELHIAGGVQCGATVNYMTGIAEDLGLKVFMPGYVDNDKMDTWLEDKNYLLSTAVSEGNPNNVIEAMAKGIKPIVHNWPGAKEQFEGYVFSSAYEAAKMLSPTSEYDSGAYRDMVEAKFGWNQYLAVRRIVDKLLTKERV